MNMINKICAHPPPAPTNLRASVLHGGSLGRGLNRREQKKQRSESLSPLFKRQCEVCIPFSAYSAVYPLAPIPFNLLCDNQRNPRFSLFAPNADDADYRRKIEWTRVATTIIGRAP